MYERRGPVGASSWEARVETRHAPLAEIRNSERAVTSADMPSKTMKTPRASVTAIVVVAVRARRRCGFYRIASRTNASSMTKTLLVPDHARQAKYASWPDAPSPHTLHVARRGAHTRTPFADRAPLRKLLCVELAAAARPTSRSREEAK